LVLSVTIPLTATGCEQAITLVFVAPGGTARLVRWCLVSRYVEIVDALPMNATGEVLKYELRERGRTKLSS